ncbi:MAG: SRPBCC family protein [Gordonia amarae]
MTTLTDAVALGGSNEPHHVDAAALTARRVPGHTLEAPFYTSPDIFDLDVSLIFGTHWIFVAAEAELPDDGDYVTVEVGTESVIVVRDDDGQVRAFRNVCRHRGARLLDDRCGAVGNIVCPYHQWTYGTDGTLRFAENQPATFDKARFGLRTVHVRTIAGLIFICLSSEAPDDIDEVAVTVEPYLLPFDLANTKVAQQSVVIEEGNWKLTMENNRECHHCEANHPALLGAYFPFHRFDESKIPARQRPVFEQYQAATSALSAARDAIGFPSAHIRELDTRVTGFMVDHMPLKGLGASYGAEGAPVSTRLLGQIRDRAFGDFHMHWQPNAWFHLLSDCAVVFSVLPVSPARTMVRTTWLVHRDAQEGIDYRLDELTHVWEHTNAEDCDLVERTQNGVGDPGYVPGPYSLVEDDVEAFVSWYVGRLDAQLNGSTVAGTRTTPQPPQSDTDDPPPVTASPQEPGTRDTATYTIEFTRTGETVVCASDQTILDAALGAGIEVASQCREGHCGTCKSVLVDGQVDMNHNGGIRQRDIDNGKILLCCSTPLSDLRVEQRQPRERRLPPG